MLIAYNFRLPFRLRLALLPALLLCVDHEAAAQTPEWSDTELADFSRTIIAGRVLAVTAGPDPNTGTLYTYVTVEVADVLKGPVSSSTVTLKQLGGEVGGLGLGIAEQAVFTPNEQVVVFLERRPRDGTLYTTALWQGKWTIDRPARDASTAVREHAAEFHRGGVAGAAGRVRDERRLDEWLNQLRAMAFTRPDPVDAPPLIAYPPETPVSSWAPAGVTPGSAEYVIFSPPWRFHQADTGTAVPVYIATGGQSGLLGGGVTEIATARTLWNQTGSALTLGPGSTRAAQCFMNYIPGNDGTVTISFMDPCAEISDAGGTLAIGGAYYSTSAPDQRVVNGTLFNKALQGMVVNNNSASALGYLTRSRCFQDIQTHELGHVIGLAHSQTAGAMMFPFIDGACLSAFSAPGEAGGGDITGALHQDDVNGVRFIYPPLTPGAATLISPTGAISNSNPTFVWNAVGNATQYYLWVNRGTTAVIQEWVTSSAAGCASGAGSCTYQPATTLSSGAHTWWIQTRNSAGDGAWSSGITFTLSGAPSATTPISPAGSISTTRPTYVWQAVSEVTWYFLWVGQGTTPVIQEWITAAAAGCASGSGSCSYTPSTALTAGAHSWRVQTWNGNGIGPWSTGLDFSVGGGVPGAATLIAPGGSITDTTPTYTWRAVAGATWYYLWTNRGTVAVKQEWVSAASAACPGGTGNCSYTPSTALASGSHTWWIQTWNSAGYGPWSAGLDFSIGGGVPGATTLIAPTGTLSDTTPTYTWQAVSSATSYYLWVNRAGVPVIQEWVSAPAAGCGSAADTTCRFTSATALSPGAHVWWIQTWNPDGYGAWSAGLSLTIAP